MVAIKQLGTNGGGYFGANSAVPFENPNYLTNMVEDISILLIPIAMVFALGYIIKRKKFAWMVFGVMTVGFLLLLFNACIMKCMATMKLLKWELHNHSAVWKEKKFVLVLLHLPIGQLLQQLHQMVRSIPCMIVSRHSAA